MTQPMSVVDRLRRAPFVKNVLTVMAGSAMAQGIGLSLSPIISRLFTPEDFGVFGSFGAVTAAMAAIATLDYSAAIMLPARREDAGQVLLLSCAVSVAITMLFASVCLLGPTWVLSLVDGHDFWLLPLLVLACLVGGVNVSLQAWCVRTKAFRDTSVSQIVRGGSSSGLQVALGFAGAGALGLLLSSVLAEALASLNLWRVVRGDIRDFYQGTTLRRLKAAATDFLDFPLYSATQNLLNALSTGVPVLLLAHYFGIAAAGAYAFSMRLLSAPMSLVFTALRQVLLQKAAEMQHQGRPLSPLFLKSTVGLFVLGLPPVVIISTWSPQLFAWAFGEQWHMAGEFARYLNIWLLFAFCNLPAVLFARLIRVQRALFVYNSLLLATRVAALVAGGVYLSPLQSVAAFSIVGGVMNVALIIFVGRALFRLEGHAGVAQPLQQAVPLLTD
jgi:lipopolysaccharide exporter